MIDVSSKLIMIVRACEYYRLHIVCIAVSGGVRQQLKTHNKNIQVHKTNGSISNMLQTCSDFLMRAASG